MGQTPPKNEETQNEVQEETVNIPSAEYTELRLYKRLYILTAQMEQGHIEMLQIKQKLAQMQSERQSQN